MVDTPTADNPREPDISHENPASREEWFDDSRREITRAFVVKQVVDAHGPQIQVKTGIIEFGVGGSVVLLEVWPPIDEDVVVAPLAGTGLCAGHKHEFLIEKVLDHVPWGLDRPVHDRQVERALNQPLGEDDWQAGHGRDGDVGRFGPEFSHTF